MTRRSRQRRSGTRPRPCGAVRVSFALLLVACSGSAISFDDEERVSLTPSDASVGDEPSPSVPVDASIPDTGRCQTVKLGQVASDSEPPTYDRMLVTGDTAQFERTPEGVVTVTCSAADEVLLRVTFGPPVGSGPHDVRVGALELAGVPSDRRCQVDLVDDWLSIDGVITCDEQPYADSNVFARGEPGGLASFVAIPR